jgi:hypothetical protein
MFFSAFELLSSKFQRAFIAQCPDEGGLYYANEAIG